MAIDWSKAPEGATHWQPENGRLMAAWVKMAEGYYWFRMPHMDNWVRYTGPVVHLGELVPKPKADQEEKRVQGQIQFAADLYELSADACAPLTESAAAWLAAQLEDRGYRKFEITDDSDPA